MVNKFLNSLTFRGFSKKEKVSDNYYLKEVRNLNKEIEDTLDELDESKDNLLKTKKKLRTMRKKISTLRKEKSVLRSELSSIRIELSVKCKDNERLRLELQEYKNMTESHNHTETSPSNCCKICYDSTSDRILRCGHKFCNVCVQNWNQACMVEGRPLNCPLCRTEQ